MKKHRIFQKERERLNRFVLENTDKVTKRFFSLDGQAYREGSIPRKFRDLRNWWRLWSCGVMIASHIILSKA